MERLKAPLQFLELIVADQRDAGPQPLGTAATGRLECDGADAVVQQLQQKAKKQLQWKK